MDRVFQGALALKYDAAQATVIFEREKINVTFHQHHNGERVNIVRQIRIKSRLYKLFLVCFLSYSYSKHLKVRRIQELDNCIVELGLPFRVPMKSIPIFALSHIWFVKRNVGALEKLALNFIGTTLIGENVFFGDRNTSESKVSWNWRH